MGGQLLRGKHSEGKKGGGGGIQEQLISLGRQVQRGVGVCKKKEIWRARKRVRLVKLSAIGCEEQGKGERGGGG